MTRYISLSVDLEVQADMFAIALYRRVSTRGASALAKTLPLTIGKLASFSESSSWHSTIQRCHRLALLRLQTGWLFREI